jgi:DNA-binding transcriptional LysR family regulator
MHNFSWDAVQTFLAVVDAGSFSAAARALHVDASTVGRRVASLEGDLGVVLFERTTAGPRLTREGMELVPAAREAQNAFGRFGALARHDDAASGTVRLASSVLFAAAALQLPALRATWPELVLDVVVGPETANLPGGEADVALRLRREGGTVASETALARRVGTATFSPWASKAWRRAHPEPLGAPGQALVPFNAAAPFNPCAGLSERTGLPAAFQGNHMPTVAEAVAAGVGVGVLLDPFMRAVFPDTVRVGPPEFAVGLWVVMRPEMRRVARVRAVADWLAAVEWSDPHGVGAPDHDGWYGPEFAGESAPAQAPSAAVGPTRRG